MNARRIRYVVVTLCAVAASTYGLRALTVTVTNPASSASALLAGSLRAAQRLAASAAPHEAAPAGDARRKARAAQARGLRATAQTAQQVKPHGDAAQPAANGSATSPRNRLASLRTPLSLEAANDPFMSSSWLPPAPKVEVSAEPPPPPPPPTAPPLPFAYLGQLDGQAAKPQVFLSEGDQLLIVAPGDVIDTRYRVESVSDQEIVLVYLPLNQRQVMPLPVEGK